MIFSLSQCPLIQESVPLLSPIRFTDTVVCLSNFMTFDDKSLDIVLPKILPRMFYFVKIKSQPR